MYKYIILELAGCPNVYILQHLNCKRYKASHLTSTTPFFPSLSYTCFPCLFLHYFLSFLCFFCACCAFSKTILSTSLLPLVLYPGEGTKSLTEFVTVYSYEKQLQFNELNIIAHTIIFYMKVFIFIPLLVLYTAFENVNNVHTPLIFCSFFHR